MHVFGSRMTSSNLLETLQALELLLKYFSRTLSSVRSITLISLGSSIVILIRTTRRTLFGLFVKLANSSNPSIVLQQEMNHDSAPLLLPFSTCSFRLVFESIFLGRRPRLKSSLKRSNLYTYSSFFTATSSESPSDSVISIEC